MPPLTLETFSDQPEPPPTVAQATAADNARLAGFDAGYAAGWEDAAAAHAQDRSQIEARTSETLQTLGFTFQEARNHILSGLEPLFSEISAKLLPRMAHTALPALVSETLLPLAEQLAEPPVTLRLHPDSRAAIERFCIPTLGLPIKIVEDPDLSPGDVRLTLDTAEARVEIDGAVAAIATALADFFALEAQVKTHAG